MHPFTERELFFRRRAGELVASFARLFGAHHLDLAERVTQETLLQALRHWPHRGVPAEPAQWLKAESRRQAQRLLLAEGSVRSRILLLLQELSPKENFPPELFAAQLDRQLSDDQVKLLFVCCHPLIPVKTRAPLVMKTLGGLGTEEIARAWRMDRGQLEEDLAQARRKIRLRRITLAAPLAPERSARLALCTATLFELFTLPDTAVSREGTRLASLLALHPTGQDSQVHALLAYILLRPEADPRALPPGAGLSDRSCRGLEHLEIAGQAGPLTPYHLYAGTAACQLAADAQPGDKQGTAKRKVLMYYDALVTIEDSPATALHRATAFFSLLGPLPAKQALARRLASKAFSHESLLPAAHAELYAKQGDTLHAKECFHKALQVAVSAESRRFLMRKLNTLACE